MRLLFFLTLIFAGTRSHAQQQLRIKVVNEDNVPLLATVIVKGSGKGAVSDSTGFAMLSLLSNGRYTLTTSSVGYQEKETRIMVPLLADSLVIVLEGAEEELEEVIVQSTRTSRTILNTPTRVETIELEEIDEKTNMRPANVAMILHESTGIQVQQTSATTGNANIRIQGLDGRYTQLLKDGFANFGNFSSGLSVLEIPPLDLKQVEIIKGPASTLFGGGAIAGVVNFISKTPKLTPEYSFILNQSNIGQSNIGAFISGRGKKAGFTVLALYNHQNPYDVDKDDFTEVPISDEFTIHPKLFLYPGEHTTIAIGNSFTRANRTGGDIVVIRDKADQDHQYFERNKTLRNISTFDLESRIGENKRVVAKQSFSIFDRSIDLPAYRFSGVDHTAFTDVSYVASTGKQVFVLGANLLINKFKEKLNPNARDNKTTTAGVYAQYTRDLNDRVKVEAGLRLDDVNYTNRVYSNNEYFVLPRISVLFNYNEKWSSRIGAGMGYKTPTLFTQETETLQYRQVLQLDNVRSEKSYGGTADVNFKTEIGENFTFSLNHMFFYTLINDPLVLTGSTGWNYSSANASEPVVSAGFETNARIIFKENFKLFLGYTLTDAKGKYRAMNQYLPLVPRTKLNSALIYEREGKLKLGLEGYFTGRQYLSDGSQTVPFSVFGFMAEKIFNKFSLYINFENFTDTRQSRYKAVASGLHNNPTFDEIWTHTEGFVVNGGIKVKL